MSWEPSQVTKNLTSCRKDPVTVFLVTFLKRGTGLSGYLVFLKIYQERVSKGLGFH